MIDQLCNVDVSLLKKEKYTYVIFFNYPFSESGDNAYIKIVYLTICVYCYVYVESTVSFIRTNWNFTKSAINFKFATYKHRNNWPDIMEEFFLCSQKFRLFLIMTFFCQNFSDKFTKKKKKKNLLRQSTIYSAKKKKKRQKWKTMMLKLSRLRHKIGHYGA